jgi:16S rRNA processing protein RimM
MPDRVVLGRIAGAHALGGEVRVRVFGDGPENLLRQPLVWLGEERDDPAARAYEVRAAEPGRPGEVRLALEGVGDRDAAAALRGLLVIGDPAELPRLAPGEYYFYELVGCRVEGRDGHPVGTVREIWDTGAHDVLVVEDAAGRRHLLPTARELMREVDLAARRIVVDIVPGLLSDEDA